MQLPATRLSVGTIGIIVGVVAVILYIIAGFTDVEPGETTVEVKKLGSNLGMQPEPLKIGTHWVEPFAFDVVTYQTKCRQMQDKPEVQIAGTADGQPVEVDFTIQLCLQPKKVPHLHETMGPDFYDNVVHPAIISIVKNRVPSEPSDVIYTAKGRANVESSINTEVTRRFGDSGVLVEINLRDVKFTNADYVAILEDKAKAAQRVEVETRNAATAVQSAIKVANIAEGEKQKRIKAAEAEREEQRLKGEGQRLQKEEDAKGILAIAKAEAEGTRLKREAMEGVGGDRIVQLAWAENLGKNVQVWGIPTGAPGTASFMDLNGILKGAFKGAGQ